MDLRSFAANSLWCASLWPEARRFQHSMGRLAETQTRMLMGYLRANRETEYGRRHGFASVSSPQQFQETVPLSTYDDYAEFVDHTGKGGRNLLTAEPVRLFEPSSGSTAASKLIPYTARLEAEFGRAIAPWIVDLYGRQPRLLSGTAYWSITPLVDGARHTSAGIPIGFEEDSAYLGRIGRILVDTVQAVPGTVKRIGDMDSFRYATLLFLLRDRSLRLISVWNPTYLELLLRPLAGWWDQLLEDVGRGGINLPGPVDPSVRQDLRQRLRPDRSRASELARIGPADFRAIWPGLTIISCWADGPSRIYADRLAGLFPGVQFQPKGLLATEAFVTFPISGAPAPVLAARSHFFEFIPEDGGRPLLAHQVEIGRTYGVVVTTGGGFYRYQLRDLVEVVAFYRSLPCLRFLGKTDQVSDWFGEKLDEGFVAGVVADLVRSQQCNPAFAMLAPEDGPDGFRYVLFLETDVASELDSMSERLDAALRANFHYDYCRRLGQLARAEVVLLRPGGEQAYVKACQDRGQRLGNIKPPLLQKSLGWRERLAHLRR